MEANLVTVIGLITVFSYVGMYFWFLWEMGKYLKGRVEDKIEYLGYWLHGFTRLKGNYSPILIEGSLKPNPVYNRMSSVFIKDSKRWYGTSYGFFVPHKKYYHYDRDDFEDVLFISQYFHRKCILSLQHSGHYISDADSLLDFLERSTKEEKTHTSTEYLLNFSESILNEFIDKCSEDRFCKESLCGVKYLCIKYALCNYIISEAKEHLSSYYDHPLEYLICTHVEEERLTISSLRWMILIGGLTLLATVIGLFV